MAGKRSTIWVSRHTLSRLGPIHCGQSSACTKGLNNRHAIKNRQAIVAVDFLIGSSWQCGSGSSVLERILPQIGSPGLHRN